jgi:hypothetical protein
MDSLIATKFSRRRLIGLAVVAAGLLLAATAAGTGQLAGRVRAPQGEVPEVGRGA